MFGPSIKVSPQIRVVLANCHKRAVPSSCSSNRRGDPTVKMKTLALVAAGSIALLGGSNAFAQCNFNAWLPANGNTGGGAFSNGASVGTPSATLAVGSPTSGAISRYSGQCGLRADVTATGNWVQDGSPAETATFRARFYFRAASVTSGDVVVYRAHNTDGAAEPIITATYNPASGGSLTIRSGLGVGAGSSQAFSPIVAGSWYSVEFNWTGGATPSLQTTVRGNVSTSAQNVDLVPSPAGNLTVFGTVSPLSIDTVQLGAVAGGTATTGNVFVDAYESRRQNAIGRLVRGDANGDGGIGGADLTSVRREIGGVALATGQPDCDENGGLGGADITCIRRIIGGI
jgi:hypothetical protein